MNSNTNQLFNSLGPVNGKLSGHVARNFLLKSNLPTNSLKDIWDAADKDRDGQLTLEEFTLAVQMIRSMKRGTNMAIANSVNAIPTAAAKTQQQSIAANWSSSFTSDSKTASPMKAGCGIGSLPSSITSEMWLVDLNTKKRYLTLFNQLDVRRTGSIPGAIAKQEFMRSGLPLPTLSQIWNLADITRTGALSADEFCVAMFLIENARLGKDPPPSLTPNLVPPQYRHVMLRNMGLSSSSAPLPGSSTASPIASTASVFSKATFENKKLENFNKGEQELERRRLEKKERERLEQEMRETERLKAEELARQQRELHSRRVLEFQRQKTKSMEEEARRRHREEEERQQEYKNKMIQWAEQRKVQLVQQNSNLQELTTGLVTRKLLLNKELADLENRCNRMKDDITGLQSERNSIQNECGRLHNHRIQIIEEVNSARSAVQSTQQELSEITNEKLRLSQQLRARRNPEEVMICILDEQEKAKQSIISLKQEFKAISDQLFKAQEDVNKCNLDKQNLDKRYEDKDSELKRKELQLEELEYIRDEEEKQKNEEKRRREEEKLKENSYQNKLKKIEESLRMTNMKQAEKETSDLRKSRQDIEQFTEFIAFKSAEADRNVRNMERAAEIASAAVSVHRSRLEKLVQAERSRNQSETNLFKIRANDSIKRTQLKKQVLRREIPKVPSTDSLINLNSLPRKASPPQEVSEQYSSTLEDVFRRSESAHTATFTINTYPDDTDDGSEIIYEDPHCIYMNMDPEGVLTNTTVTRKTNQPKQVEEEHVYADPIMFQETAAKQREVIFEVEAIDSHRNQNDDELSFNVGERMKVFAVHQDFYEGEHDGKTGFIPIQLVEKCEWIYSDISKFEKVAVALYDFESDVAGDLSFKAGEIILAYEQLGEWYRGQINDRHGIFPCNFVQFKEDEETYKEPPPFSFLPSGDIKPIAIGRILQDYNSDDIHVVAGDVVSILSQQDSDSSFIQNSAGIRAWIKTSLLKVEANNAPVGAERIPASLHCYTLYQYSAQKEDELSFKASDIITITEQSDPNWWIGRLGVQVGVLPSNYVEQINDMETWDTVKSWSANLSPNEDERTRQEAIHELISTEKTYIDDLLLVIEVFYNPLCSVASELELSKVFVNWQEIVLCNARLFRSLYNNRNINSFESVGEIILEEIDNLIGPYTKFCSSQRQAMITLQEHTSPMFKTKESECAQSPKVGKLPLSTFLLKPMQRITKYPLLIKKILEHTREEHSDYQALRNALNRTEYLLTTVNEAVRATSRLETLQRNFAKCLSSEFASENVQLNSNTNLLGPRKLLHFTSVYKSKGSKELFAVLFNDVFWVAKMDRGRYGNKAIDLDARDFDSIKFEFYKDPFFLHNITLTENTKSQSDTIQFVYNDKSYSLYCVGTKECQELSQALVSAVQQASLLHQSHHRTQVPDPTVSGAARLSIRLVEAHDLALPSEEKPTSIFVQASLHGHVQRTATSTPKWDHTFHFILQDLNNDKIHLTVNKEQLFAPNIALGKFDLSIHRLLKSDSTGPWNKRLILTDTTSGMVNVSISIKYNSR